MKQEKCSCRNPKRHNDCAYCGTGYTNGVLICGVCREAGIDGLLLRGTGRVVCALHKKERGKHEGKN
jgi:hypothetical protein